MPVYLLLSILFIEVLVLFWGQRRIVPLLLQRSRALAYFLAAPGTVLHELSHLLAAVLLQVPVGRVELFRPRSDEEGSLQLGMVETAQTSPVKQAIVAAAPAVLVPLLLAGVLTLLLGSDLWAQPLGAFLGAPLWAQALSLYLLLSSAGAAFPSAGDYIPPLGALFVVSFFALFLLLLRPPVEGLLQITALGLAPAAIAAAIQLALLRPK